MLIVLAFVLQTLLLFDCLLRRILQVVLPCKVTPLERYANTSILSTLAANALNAATLPLQALATLVGAWSRYVMPVRRTQSRCQYRSAPQSECSSKSSPACS